MDRIITGVSRFVRDMVIQPLGRLFGKDVGVAAKNDAISAASTTPSATPGQALGNRNLWGDKGPTQNAKADGSSPYTETQVRDLIQDAIKDFKTPKARNAVWRISQDDSGYTEALRNEAKAAFDIIKQKYADYKVSDSDLEHIYQNAKNAKDIRYATQWQQQHYPHSYISSEQIQQNEDSVKKAEDNLLNILMRKKADDAICLKGDTAEIKTAFEGIRRNYRSQNDADFVYSRQQREEALDWYGYGGTVHLG